jgi:alpha-glucosidase
MSRALARRALPSRPWWDGAVIYQCYPRSFMDSNGDGIGDLAGITSQLDHLRGSDHALGVDAIWLSPIYPHGGVDGGYDVIDHGALAPEYGALTDFDRLVAEAHARGLRVLLDLVVGHVSDRHPWFLEARASRDSARRDWFIWAEPRPGGGPPTNWVSIFGGPSWTFDFETEQYYYHTYYPEQPDLNWRNPEVRRAVADVLRFWLDRGIDGFRVDAAQNLVKDERLRDNPPAKRRVKPFPPEPGGLARRWTSHLPGARSVLRGFRSVVGEYPDTFLLGEVYAPPERLASYLRDGGGEGLHAILNMELGLSDWDPRAIVRAIRRSERHLVYPMGPTWNLSNHDLSRHATRWGPERSRLAALILLTLRGTVCLYQGEEIGMTDHPAVPQPMVDRWGRDPCRTPMQWTPAADGGFSTGRPWLPLNDPGRTNVAGQLGDPGSLLSLYRKLIRMRNTSPAIRHGSLALLSGLPRDVVGWERIGDGERVLVLGNLGDRSVEISGREAGRARILAATDDRVGTVKLDRLALGPNEGLVLRVTPALHIASGNSD